MKHNRCSYISQYVIAFIEDKLVLYPADWIWDKTIV